MKLTAFGMSMNARDCAARGLFLVLAVATLVSPGLSDAQPGAASELVEIPGSAITGWGEVANVRGRWVRPAGAKVKVPAVLILHGSGGVDGRGAFYASALQEAGIATLEITMFPPGGRPREGTKATMPHAAAALQWLATQPSVDSERVGVMGFSWGGVMTTLMASEAVQARLGNATPHPVAFAPLYPTCGLLARMLSNPSNAFYDAQRRMGAAGAAPILIQVGTRDDYEEGERPCDALVAMFPASEREHTTVRYVDGATHGFDSQNGVKRFSDPFAHGGKGGMVNMVPSPQDAAASRAAVVSFFVLYLKP